MTPYQTLSTRLAIAAALLPAICGCSSWRPDRAAQTATGFASHVICDEVFITGTSAQRAFDERIRPLPGQGAVVWALRHRVDVDRQEVSVTLAGGFESRARFSQATGCQVLAERPADPGAAAAVTAIAGLPHGAALSPSRDAPAGIDPAGPVPVVATSPLLRAVLERAVPVPQDRHRTRAIVVMQDGQIVGERYGDGFGVDTTMLGFSVSKALINALVGILVRQGRLQLDQPAAIGAWHDPADPRHAITVEHLLRQTSGLDLPQDNSGFDASSQIMYTEPDKAGKAAAARLAATPGTRWAYSDTNYLLLSRLVRDAAGGSAADVTRLMATELAAPLGLRHLRIDSDATGTGVGAAHVLASARDFARIGQLYLDDGVANGRRLLPAGWVQWSRSRTLDTGYGAGWWTNLADGNVPQWGAPWGMPAAPRDMFYARGYMGQFIVVVPSRRLVIVRMSSAPEQGDDIVETNRVVGDILAALSPRAAAPGVDAGRSGAP